ncbi:MAG: NADH-quinone oxidoreductase subunit C [Candidatus Aminicenantia bacterium]
MKESLGLRKLKEKFPNEIIEISFHFGDETILIQREALFEAVKFLKHEEELNYELLLDITCVDLLGLEDTIQTAGKDRFEVICHLYSFKLNHRIRLKIRVSESEAWVESLTPLWENANWLEREVFDMFGLKFKNHPDLRRILMYEGFEGYPLRKDYPLKKRQPRTL